jgi:Predicted nucleoside-diphosphate-sugar epimerases
MKKAVLFGATGFVGSYILQELLQHPDYEQVIAVVRKDLGRKDSRLKTIIADQQSVSAHKEALAGDDIFIAIGTTKKKTPDQWEYYAIDHGYPVLAASLARERGATALFLVSSVGANPDAAVFYTRTKGEAERDILALDFAHTHIFRPSIIMGERPEHRPMEKMLVAACHVLNPFIAGSLQRYRGIPAKDIAKAMVTAANRPAEKVRIYEWADMNALL